jgi:hypothetical protein
MDIIWTTQDVKLVELTGPKNGTYDRQNNERQTNSNNKNITDQYRYINEFNKGYQPWINLAKDENCDPLAGSHSMLNMWNDCVYRLLNVF